MNNTDRWGRGLFVGPVLGPHNSHAVFRRSPGAIMKITAYFRSLSLFLETGTPKASQSTFFGGRSQIFDFDLLSHSKVCYILVVRGRTRTWSRNGLRRTRSILGSHHAIFLIRPVGTVLGAKFAEPRPTIDELCNMMV